MGNLKKIRERAGDLAVGKLKSGVCDHPALLQGHIKASFSFSLPSVSSGEEEEHLLICLQCTDLVDCLQLLLLVIAFCMPHDHWPTTMSEDEFSVPQQLADLPGSSTYLWSYIVRSPTESACLRISKHVLLTHPKVSNFDVPLIVQEDVV